MSALTKDFGFSHTSPLYFSILLYSKVREPQVMLEVGSSWLRDHANQSLPEYGSLLELYLVHVLKSLFPFSVAADLLQTADFMVSKDYICKELV